MLEIVVPDRIGEVEGWRAWRVVGGERYPLLASVTHSGTIWHPDRWTWATCEGDRECQDPGAERRRVAARPSSKGESIPGTSCSCGLYAAASRAQLVGLGYPKQYNHGRPVFIGLVAFAGKVIPGTAGWRAQKGRIAALYVPHVWWRYVDPLEAMYQVPVFLENTTRVPGGR